MRKAAIGAVAALLVFLVLVMFVVRLKHIDAHQRGVKVSWSGIVEEPVQPGVAIYCPFMTNLYIADVGQQRFVMNNLPASIEKAARGREKDEFIVRSSDNQDMTLSVEVLWHRDPLKVVEQQKFCNVENDELFTENILRQPVRNTVKNKLTEMKAIDAYSGSEHVKAQIDIELRLKHDPELVRNGCIIDSFLIEVRLDNDYTAPIKQRQVAIQEQLAYVEKTKAAEAKALQAKADAQADYNTQVVAAERDKQIAVTKAQQLNESAILAAEAAKQQVILEGEGKKASAENEAAAILAVGKAQAESSKLLYTAYESSGGKTFASIEIAKQMAVAYSGVKGFIPEKMTVNTFAESFQKGVGVVIGGQ